MKHVVIVVLSLILALCLMGSVQANENVSLDCDDIQITQEDIPIESAEYDTLENDSNEICIEDDSSGLNGELSDLNVDKMSENSDSKKVADLIGIREINEKNTENILNDEIDSPNGYVAYNNGNLLMLPLNNLITFQNEEELLFSGYNGLTDNLWNNIQYIGVKSEITSRSSETVDEKPLYTGFISNQENYPQNDLPLENAYDALLGVSGDSDDNAFIWSGENPDEKAYFSVDMVNKTSDDIVKSNISEMEKDLSFNIGKNASLKALDYFKSQGINIGEDCPYLYELTSASKVDLNKTSTYGAIIGMSIVLGDGLNKNIYPLHNPLWQDLIFYYIWVNSTDKTDMHSYALKYDENLSELVESNEVKSEGDKIAYDLGLFDKKPDDKKPYENPYERHAPTFKQMVKNKRFVITDELTNSSDVNSTKDNTNVTNATVGDDKKDNIAKNSVAYSGNPFNLLYILISIIMVSVIFGVGYSKRS